jgi:hypothetical protein
MQSWASHSWWSRAGHGPSRASYVARRFSWPRSRSARNPQPLLRILVKPHVWRL